MIQATQVVCSMCQGRGWVPQTLSEGLTTFAWNEKCSACGGCGFSVQPQGNRPRDLPPYKKRSEWRDK